MQDNPLYKFLKENNLTTKDESSFMKEYSDPSRAKELHGFLKSNNLTTKDEVSFYDTYFKKKNLGGVVSSPTGSQSVSKSFISSLPEQKSIYAPSQKLASESTTVVAPKQAKLISEANKRGDQITKEAIANSNDLYLKSQNKGGYKFTKEDPSILNNKKELEQDLKDGTLQVVKSPKTGKYVLAYKGDMLKSFSQAWDGVLERQANDKYVAGLSTEDKIKHYEAQDILNQDKYLETAPSGFSGSVGRLLGENAEPLIKLAAMANIGGKAAQAAGATAQTVANAQKFGSFLAFATDAGYSGYANNTERVYKSLRKQDSNGDPVEQMRKAENAGLIGEASGIGMAAGMTGIFKNLKNAAETINTKPFVSALETMSKHTSKEAAVQGSISALNSIVSDLGAKSQGMDIGVGDIVENALESGKQMAQFVGVTGLAMGTLTGLMKVPGYVKAQAKGLVSELPREEVKAVYQGAEANGIVPEGTADRVINSLNQYDKAKEKLPEGLTEDKKASLTGIQEKIDKLEESKKKLAPQYHDRVDNTINSLKDRAIKILESKDPLAEEVDNTLGVKGSEEIAGEPAFPIEVKVTEDIEAQKADIERRRKEELDAADVGARLVFDRETSRPLDKGDEVLADKMIDNIISKAKNIAEVQLKIEQLGYNMRGNTADLFNEFVENRINGKTTKTFAEWRNEAKNNIENVNAKYDAELSALEEVKPTEEEISVYHGGSVKDLSNVEGGLFVSADKNQAEAYAKGNQGEVQEFKLNKSDVSNENNVREIINELGLKSKEEGWDFNDLMLHEIVDSRFETSLSDSDLSKLFKELDKRGYKAIEMMATDVSGKQRNVNDILVLNPKETLKGVRPTEVKSVEQLREQEQSELDSRIANAEQYRVDGKVDRAKLTNEEDIKAFDEVYNKYDKLISPLLEKPSEVKAKEKNPVEEKLKKGEKYVYHHTSENISNITEGSAWFTSNKFGAPTRARGVNKVVKIINPSDFNLASNKEFMSLSDMSLNEKKKVLQERGYEGVKRTIDGDSHYWIFDVSKLKDINIAEKAKESKPTEAKTVEQLREQEQSELDSRIANAEQYRVDGKVDRAKLTNEEDIKAYDEVWKKYDKLISPLLEKPAEQKITVELLSSKEPPQKEGETIVTLSGKTEKERVESIDRRKRETKVSDKVVAENDLIQDAEAYFKKDGRYKNSAEGRNELNNLRIKARELGLEIDTDRDAVTRRGKSGRPTKVRYNNKADGEAVVDPNGRTITERAREVQDAFEELTDAGIFLDVQTELGKRMSASQIDAAIKDILDGIPSKRAETYLNALEKAIAEDAFPLYDKALGDIAPRLDEIRAQLGIEREVIGEPMDEAALNKFLGEEAELTPEEEQILLDNVENLLYEYETTEEGPQGEVQPIEARAEEGVSGKAEPVAEAKEAGEAPKPVKEVYDEFSSKKSELAKKKIINDNFDTIVEDLIKNKKIERIC